MAGLWLAGGCAAYDFDLVEPAELARRIANSESEAVRPPLRYTFRSYENRLVMHIHNPTGSAVLLEEQRSVVVDGSGQSRPVRGVMIAPASFAKLILPPLRPVYQASPAFGIGVGVGVGMGPHGRRPFDPYAWDAPRYFSEYDGGVYHWEWRGESIVRLTLGYRQGERAWQDDFVFRRVKR